MGEVSSMPAAATEPENEASKARTLRYVKAGVVYHAINRITGGMFLLQPRPQKRRMICGVLGYAAKKHTGIRLHGYVFLSNHFHLLVSVAPEAVADVGADLPPDEAEEQKLVKARDILSGYMKTVQGEISQRLTVRQSPVTSAWIRQEEVGAGDDNHDHAVRKKGRIWEKRYEASALPDADSELEKLNYVLAQGVKEHLVEKCVHWPGPHMAKAFSEEGKGFETGIWFWGTAYSLALKAWKSAKNRGENVRKPMRQDFEETFEVVLHPLPSCADMDWGSYAAFMRGRMQKVEAEAAEDRRKQGWRKVKGAQQCCLGDEQRSPDDPRRHARKATASEKTRPRPWYDRKYRMVAWARSSEPEVMAYIADFDSYQANPPDGVRRNELLRPFTKRRKRVLANVA